MTILQIATNFVVTAPDAIQAVYTAPADKSVVVVSFTAANTSAVNASYKAYIVSTTGVVQPQIPFKVVIWGESDLGIGLVSQAIPPGGQLRVESSAVDAIYFTVTGRQDD